MRSVPTYSDRRIAGVLRATGCARVGRTMPVTSDIVFGAGQGFVGETQRAAQMPNVWWAASAYNSLTALMLIPGSCRETCVARRRGLSRRSLANICNCRARTTSLPARCRCPDATPCTGTCHILRQGQQRHATDARREQPRGASPRAPRVLQPVARRAPPARCPAAPIRWPYPALQRPGRATGRSPDPRRAMGLTE